MRVVNLRADSLAWSSREATTSDEREYKNEGKESTKEVTYIAKILNCHYVEVSGEL
jgi:hypothetical protein